MREPKRPSQIKEKENEGVEMSLWTSWLVNNPLYQEECVSLDLPEPTMIFV